MNGTEAPLACTSHESGKVLFLSSGEARVFVELNGRSGDFLRLVSCSTMLELGERAPSHFLLMDMILSGKLVSGTTCSRRRTCGPRCQLAPTLGYGKAAAVRGSSFRGDEVGVSSSTSIPRLILR